MRKLLGLTLCIMFILSGCGSSDDKDTTICTFSTTGLDTKTTLKHDDDKVYTQTIENTLNLAEAGADEESVKAQLDSFATYYDVKGVTYKYDITDGVVHETITVDYTKADFDELKNIQLVSSTDEDISYVDYDLTIEGAKDQGFTCNKK